MIRRIVWIVFVFREVCFGGTLHHFLLLWWSRSDSWLSSRFRCFPESSSGAGFSFRFRGPGVGERSPLWYVVSSRRNMFFPKTNRFVETRRRLGHVTVRGWPGISMCQDINPSFLPWHFLCAGTALGSPCPQNHSVLSFRFDSPKSSGFT